MIFMKRVRYLFNCFISLVVTMASALIPINTSSGDTTTSTFQVTATVASSCTVTATSIAFGNYTLAQLDNSSTITATCTNGTTYTNCNN